MNRHPLAAVTVAYFAFLLLAGCAALGVPAADTFNKKAAGAVQTVNAASQLTLTLLQARKITPDESDKYIDAFEEAQSAIDFTRTIYKTNPADAENRLAAIIAGLNILLAELETRK
jgi:hypothetical protein